MFNFFPTIVGQKDRFLFYYSGHGSDLGTNVGYFVFGNATETYDQDTYLPADTWKQWSARLAGKEQLFLFEGCSLGLGSISMVSSRDNGALLRQMAKDPSRLVFAATKGREEAYASTTLSYFTQEFLNAVREEQQDPNGIGFTTIDKVAASMAPNLAALAKAGGHSWFRTMPMALDPNKYPGTFVFINPNIPPGSSSATHNLVAVAIGKSPEFFPVTPSSLAQSVERVAQDYAEARKSYQKAADAGNLTAMANLAWLYANGLGVAQDYAEARKWYQEAADAGDTETPSIPASPTPAPATPTPMVAQGQKRSSPFVGERYPQTRFRLLTADDLQGKSLTDLRYEINEVYARHGASFSNTPDIQQQFQKFSWYHPDPSISLSDIDWSMSDIEKQNIKLLAQYRDMLQSK